MENKTVQKPSKTKALRAETSKQNGETCLSSQEGPYKSKISTLYNHGVVKKHLRRLKTSDLEGDGLQQHKTSSTTPGQESEGITRNNRHSSQLLQHYTSLFLCIFRDTMPVLLSLENSCNLSVLTMREQRTIRKWHKDSIMQRDMTLIHKSNTQFPKSVSLEVHRRSKQGWKEAWWNKEIRAQTMRTEECFLPRHVVWSRVSGGAGKPPPRPYT